MLPTHMFQACNFDDIKLFIGCVHCVTHSELFSRIQIRSISPYSVRIRENANQNSSEYGHFSRSGPCQYSEIFGAPNFSCSFVCIFKIPWRKMLRVWKSSSDNIKLFYQKSVSRLFIKVYIMNCKEIKKKLEI